MVTILPPDGSLTFITGLALPLVLGFLIGIVLKGALKIGIALAGIVLLLMGIGMVSPPDVIGPIVVLFRSGSALTTKVNQIARFLPYSSVTFIIGLAIGFFKV